MNSFLLSFLLKLPNSTFKIITFRTNLPKELMDFPDLPYKGLNDVSFLKSWQVLEYIEQFTEYFGLNKHIRVRKCTKLFF